jgi:hypothetical protein
MLAASLFVSMAANSPIEVGHRKQLFLDGATHWMFDPALERYVLFGRTLRKPPEIEAANGPVVLRIILKNACIDTLWCL